MKTRKPVIEVDIRIHVALRMGVLLKLVPLAIALIRALKFALPQFRS